MPSTTPKGFPYPLPSEPVAQGAAAIRALAEAIDAKTSARIAGARLTAAAADIDMTAIPQIYTALRLLLYLRSSDAGAAVTVHAQFNGDTGSTYDSIIVDQTANPVTSVNVLNGTNVRIGRAPAAGAPARAFSQTIVDLLNYTNTDGDKNVHAQTVSKESAAAVARSEVNVCSWHPAAATAINRIRVYPSSGNWIVGSWWELIGIS